MRAHTLPVAIEAERAVLGCRLDAERCPAELRQVGVDDFGDPRHALIWRVAAELESRGRPSDWLAVGVELEAQEIYRGRVVDRLEYLTTLVASWRSWLCFRGPAYYVQALKDASLQRGVLTAAADIAEACYTARDPVALARWSRWRMCSATARAA